LTKTKIDDCPDAFNDATHEIQMWYSKDFVYFNWYFKDIQINYEFEDFKEIIKAFKHVLSSIDLDNLPTLKQLQKIRYESENNAVSFHCDGLDKRNKPYFVLNTGNVAIGFLVSEILPVSIAFNATKKVLRKQGLI